MTTADKIRAMLEENPRRTLQSMGDELGISREGVRRNIAKYGLNKISAFQPKRCSTCSKRLHTSNKSGHCRKHKETGIRTICKNTKC